MYVADNGDGTFSNPILMVDHPDCDIIRVGSDFYMISSSMSRMPGLPIQHSRDLVNWSTIGHVFDELKLGPQHDLVDGDIYGQGLWAPFLRHDDACGTFYAGANSNADGFVLFTATDPRGPWTMHPLGVQLYDPGLLIDDDRLFVFYGAGTIRMIELDRATYLPVDPPIVVYENEFRPGLEGVHAYRIDGQYYLSMTLGGRAGSQVVGRSAHREGPYEVRIVHDSGAGMADSYSHQGGLVDTPTGEWWWFLFQDRDYVGRCPVIQPLTWIDGWPYAGDPAQLFGSVATYRKPIDLGPGPEPELEWCDDFDAERLDLDWSWNHNPLPTHWSLTARPGWFRLTTAPAGSLATARNSLMRRIVGPDSAARIRLDTRGLRDGDIAGLATTNWARPYGLIGVRVQAGRRSLFTERDGHIVEEVHDLDPVIELSSTVSKHGMATFHYLDAGGADDNGDGGGADGGGDGGWRQLGDSVAMRFSIGSYLGYAFALVAWSEGVGGGSADFDHFVLSSHSGRANAVRLGDEIDAYRFDSSYAVRIVPTERHHFGDVVEFTGPGSQIVFTNANLDTGADRIDLDVHADAGGELELRLDHGLGELVGRINLDPDFGVTGWRSVSAELDRQRATGHRRLHLKANRLPAPIRLDGLRLSGD